MTRIDADFLRNVQEHCNGGLEWCEKREIERNALVRVAADTASIAAAEDAGLASYGVAMFKLGYEVRRVQELQGKYPCGPGDENNHPKSPYTSLEAAIRDLKEEAQGCECERTRLGDEGNSDGEAYWQGKGHGLKLAIKALEPFLSLREQRIDEATGSGRR